MSSNREVNRRKRRLRNFIAFKMVTSEQKKVCLRPVIKPSLIASNVSTNPISSDTSSDSLNCQTSFDSDLSS